MNTKKITDPYQIFFPLGLLCGLIGTSVWVGFTYQLIHFYPRAIHTQLMMGGFFMLVAIGFLMTAVPKFTGTVSASFYEKLVLFVTAFFLMASSLSENNTLFYFLSATTLLQLFIFGYKRMSGASLKPPPSFIFVGAGIMLGIISSFILSYESALLNYPRLLVLGHQGYYYGLCYGLVLGIGTQLIPNLMGTRSQLGQIQPTPMHAVEQDALLRSQYIKFSGLFILSFLIEAFVSDSAGKLIRAALASFILLFRWNIYRRPAQKTVMTWCLWLCSWFLMIGGWPQIFWPSYAIHLNHLIFIGALSLMIFAIATRVSLAHGGYSLDPERKSKILIATAVLLILSVMARVAAPFSPSEYNNHLAYASLSWIAACLVWGFFFLPRIFRFSKNGKSSQGSHC